MVTFDCTARSEMYQAADTTTYEGVLQRDAEILVLKFGLYLTGTGVK
jgi:hypothetical protein